MRDLFEALRAHCRTKPASNEVEECDGEETAYRLLDGFLDIFAWFLRSESVLLVRCRDAVLAELMRAHDGIRASDRMRWDVQGWQWTDVSIDGTLPEATIASLIDDSYEIVLETVDETRRYQVELIRQRVDEAEVLSALLSRYGLAEHAEDIRRASRRCLLLRTRRVVESELIPGESRIGGVPDLPEDQEWPAHPSGRPLAFLAQVNLSELRRAGGMPELPAKGILWFFSVFGWQAPGECDPEIPEGGSEADRAKVVSLADERGAVRRRDAPAGASFFEATRVQLVPTMALPNSTEPALASLGWSEDEQRAYDEQVRRSFNAIADYRRGYPPKHLLLGFADFGEFDRPGFRLLFQLASDEEPMMCWGDDGTIYFWIRPVDLRNGDFSGVVCDYKSF